MSIKKISPSEAQDFGLTGHRPAPVGSQAPGRLALAATSDAIERDVARRPTVQAWPCASAELAPSSQLRSRWCGPSTGVRVAGCLGALVGFGLPCTAGIALLVPAPSWVNPSGVPAVGYAASLLLGGTVIGTGIGLLTGRWLGQACCGAR